MNLDSIQIVTAVFKLTSFFSAFQGQDSSQRYPVTSYICGLSARNFSVAQFVCNPIKRRGYFPGCAPVNGAWTYTIFGVTNRCVYIRLDRPASFALAMWSCVISLQTSESRDGVNQVTWLFGRAR